MGAAVDEGFGPSASFVHVGGGIRTGFYFFWFCGREQSMKDLDLHQASFTSAVAYELRFTLLGYRDRGDRFLVATAKVYGLTLVTADQVCCKFPVYQF